jgi:hypothetical protein
MKTLNALATVLCCALLVAALSPAARADDWNRKTFITFSDSVEVPGAVLQAGKYVFKLMDSNADRHIVQVFNERENKLYATVLAIPSYREIPPDNTVITFYEVPAGNPAPIKKWFYPGDNYGQEFVYDGKRRAEILALGGQINQSVQTASVKTETLPTVTSTETTTAEETTPAPENNEVAAAPVPAPVETTAEPALESPAPPEETAEPQPQQPATPAPATDDNTSSELPHTATVMPLVALIGIVSLLSAVGLRTMRKSS